MSIAMVLGLAGMLVALGCSNDVELPPKYHQDYLAAPTDVEASVDGGAILVSWQMASTENVAAFVVSFTDETGSVETRSVDEPGARSLEETSLSVEAGSVLQVQVRAADENGFLGPASAAVSLSVSD